MPPQGHEPFLRAICENPEDDTARLVYADWLDENGDPDRAEFIRLQVAVPRRPEEHDERYARAEELRRKHWDEWRAELPQLSGIAWSSNFWRGFVPSVSVTVGKWLIRQHEQVFSSAPIHSLVLHDAGLATLRAVLEVPEIERLTNLSLLHSRVREGEWQLLAQCPRLVRLRALRFDAPRIMPGWARRAFTEEDAQAFVDSPYLTRLEHIHIKDGIVTAALELLRTRFKDVRTWSR